MPEWNLRIDVPPTRRTPESLPSGLPGILVQNGVPEGAQPDKSRSRGRPLAIVVHGSMAHKNALFYKDIAQQVPMDSFRCDMRFVVSNQRRRRGSRKLGDEQHGRAFNTDQDWASDLHAIIAYLTTEFGYRVELMVGHSKGSFCMFGYLANYCVPGARQYQPPPRLVVSIAGRFRMEVRLFWLTSAFMVSST